KALSGALDQNDAAAVSDAAHAFKGALMMLRAHPAAAIAKEIEIAGRQGDLHTARVQLPALNLEAQRLLSALLAYCDSPELDGAVEGPSASPRMIDLALAQARTPRRRRKILALIALAAAVGCTQPTENPARQSSALPDKIVIGATLPLTGAEA